MGKWSDAIEDHQRDANQPNQAQDKVAFDVFRGLTTDGFQFRGLDKHDGATFEHEPCGMIVRLGPGAQMRQLRHAISEHNCEEYRKDNKQQDKVVDEVAAALHDVSEAAEALARQFRYEIHSGTAAMGQLDARLRLFAREVLAAGRALGKREGRQWALKTIAETQVDDKSNCRDSMLGIKLRIARRIEEGEGK